MYLSVAGYVFYQTILKLDGFFCGMEMFRLMNTPPPSLAEVGRFFLPFFFVTVLRLLWYDSSSLPCKVIREKTLLHIFVLRFSKSVIYEIPSDFPEEMMAEKVTINKIWIIAII